MSVKTLPPGFHPIRHDRLLQEQVHDVYKSKGKPPGAAVCPQCGAVFQQGHWRWGEAPVGAQQESCPACLRLQDKIPAGFVTLEGAFFLAHQDEIMRLVHNLEEQERAGHPLKRIIATEVRADSALVTTTDIHLARAIGEALSHAYQGELEYHYNPAEQLLRVHWSR